MRAETLDIIPDRGSIAMPRFNHQIPFDPTHGYSFEQMLAVGAPPEPDDYATFWRATREEAMAVDLRLEARRVASPWRAVELYEVEYDSLHGVRIGAWVTAPADRAAIERGLILGHGYGGREAPDRHRHAARQATIMPCARGFHRSAHPDLPDSAEFHVVHGIDHRETYLHRGCVADCWLAGSALAAMFPEVDGRLDYSAGSFGGGIGAMALAWDDRIRRAHLGVPSFGNHPLRLTLTCHGSGSAVKARFDDHPEIVDVLAYFDAAVAARRIRIPVLFDCALFDPAVPPAGQFAVHNACPQPKTLHVRQAGHFEYDTMADDRRLTRALDRFFGMDGAASADARM